MTGLKRSTQQSASTANKLGGAYILAIGTIALLSIGSFLGLRTLVEEQKKSTTLVNIAGRQRRLSQTIAIDCLKLASPALYGESDKVRPHLEKQLELFKTSHSALMNRTGPLDSTRALSAGEHRIYYDKPEELDKSVQEFCTHVANVIRQPDNSLTVADSDIQYILSVAETSLLTKLDKAVSQCDIDSQASVSDLESTEIKLLFATLLLLVAEAVFIFRPLSNRLRAQLQNVVDSQKELAAVFETAGDALLTLDKNFAIKSANPRVGELWGYPESELIAKNFKDLVDANTLVVGRRTETDAIHRNGSKVPMELIVTQTPLSDRVLLTVAAHDTSQRKNIDSQVSEFYSIFAHELRAPLSSIATSLKAIQTGQTGQIGGRTQVAVDLSLLESDRLVKLVDDYLDLIKNRAGMVKLELADLSLSMVMNAAVWNVSAEAKAKNIAVKDDASTDFRLKGDKEKLTRVMSSLLAHAIAVSPANSTVTVKLQRATLDGWCRCTVIDQGPALTKERLVEFFSLFNQSAGNGKAGDQIGGTGYDLAMSKSIIQQHAGTIGVDSVGESGSQVWFELPVHR